MKSFAIAVDVFAAVSCGQVVDTVYANGKICTVNEKPPWTDAVANKDGKFIKVGPVDDVQTHIGDNTETIDLGGKFVMPGVKGGHRGFIPQIQKRTASRAR